MEYIFIFLTVFCVLEIIKYIKKPANTCQEFFEKSLKFIELNFFAQQPDRKKFQKFRSVNMYQINLFKYFRTLP